MIADGITDSHASRMTQGMYVTHHWHLQPILLQQGSQEVRKLTLEDAKVANSQRLRNLRRERTQSTKVDIDLNVLQHEDDNVGRISVEKRELGVAVI